MKVKFGISVLVLCAFVGSSELAFAQDLFVGVGMNWEKLRQNHSRSFTDTRSLPAKDISVQWYAKKQVGLSYGYQWNIPPAIVERRSNGSVAQHFERKWQMHSGGLVYRFHEKQPIQPWAAGGFLLYKENFRHGRGEYAVDWRTYSTEGLWIGFGARVRVWKRFSIEPSATVAVTATNSSKATALKLVYQLH